MLKRSPEQEAALQELLRAQQSVHSPRYHRWLTPEEFGNQFGPALEDIDKVTAWLQSKGIQVSRIAKGRTSIEFSATHQQIQDAFHTELHWFDSNTGRQYSNILSPKIPSALSAVVAGISPLNSYVSKPLSHVSHQLSSSGGVSGTHPSYASGTANYLAPGDFWTIYNATPAESGGITGKGVTIGIAGRSDVSESDVSAFRSAYMGTSYTGGFQTLHNGPDPGTPEFGGDDVENALDVEWAGAVAPDANVLLVSSQTDGADGVYLSAEYLIDNNLADIVSVSYGSCESFQWGWVISYGGLWEQAAAQGITVAVAAGDNGSAGCDVDVDTVAEHGLQVNGLASSPYNVAVGGTEFVDHGNSWMTLMSPTPLPNTSAQGYIPEEVWNESQIFSTLYAASGGASNCYFSSLNGSDTAACGGGWPKPDWQAGVTGIPEDGVRDLPDLSFTAAMHDGYLITLGGNTKVVGGTSAATPAFAGVMALVNQKAGGRQGLANFQLYTLAGQQFGAAGVENHANLQSCNACRIQSSTNSCVFYDVTSGSNAVPCRGDTENCSVTDSSATGMLTGYQAGVGYDLASGLGSVNITNLVNAWRVPSNGNFPTTVSLQISPTSGIMHGSPVSVSIEVAPAGGGTPSGSVSLIANGAVIAVVQLSKGAWSGTSNVLPGGDYQVSAQYSGDVTYAASTSAEVQVHVTPEPSTTTISVVAKDAQIGNVLALNSIPYGSNVIMNAMVKGQSGIGLPSLHSAVEFYVDGNQYVSVLGPAGYTAYPVTTLAPGGYTATAIFSGDASFASSPSAPSPPFTVVPARTAVSLSSGTTAGELTPVTALVSAATFGNAPTGPVTFFVNGIRVGTAAVQPYGSNFQHWSYTTFSISTAWLSAGPNAITAQYVGDANYALSPISAPLTINPNTITLTVPIPPAVPSMAQEYKTGAQVSISAIILGKFENLQVRWAPGINPTAGWSSSGITVNNNLSQPVLNAPVATWDTSLISTSGYYTVSLSVTSAGIVNTATTGIYVEPDLVSANWPQSFPAEVYMNGSPGPPALVPVADASGNTGLLFGAFGWPGGHLFTTSMDGSAQKSYSLNHGSWWEPAAANLHFSSGDDLIYPDANSMVVVRSDGTKEVLPLPASISNQSFNFKFSQVIADDVDGDSIPEVVALGQGPGPTPWSTMAYLFAWRNNGQQLNSNFPIAIPDWDGDLTFAPARALVGDVDGDGQKEFVALEGTSGTTFTPRLFAADGSPKQWNARTIQHPYALQMALADLDHNGKLETILESCGYATPPGFLHVLNPDGTERPGWPVPLTYYASNDSIAVGDLNRDGDEEIVLSHGGALSVFKKDGTLLWPALTNPTGAYGAAVLADVNGDGYPEIVTPYSHASDDPSAGTYNVSQLLVLDRMGTTIRSWTLAGVNGMEAVNPNVVAGDFLGDGKSEIASGYALLGTATQLDDMGIQVATTQMGAAVLDTGWNYNPAASDWPMLHRNSHQSAVLCRVRPTTISLSRSAYGASSATFTLTVVPSSGGPGKPTGNANLIDGDQNIGSCVLSSGSCVIAPTLPAGKHSLVAGYVGDRNFDVSYSSTITQTITAVPTSTILTILPDSPSLQAASSYTLTATVNALSGITVPTGRVVFTIGSATQTVDLNASGVANYAGAAPAASGQLTLSAAYLGSTTFSASTSDTLIESIIANPIPTISSMSPAYIAAGSMSFTLTLNGSGFVNSSVAYWGNTALATQFVSSTQLAAQVSAAEIATSGVGAITVLSPSPGGSASNTLRFEVDSAGSGSATAPSFNNAAATVSAGNTATYAVTLPLSASAVSVACLNLPQGSTCSYSASMGAISIATASSTPIGTYQVTVIFTETLPGLASAAIVQAPLLLFPLLLLRRKVVGREIWITTSCCMLLLFIGAVLVTSCGGGGGPSSVQPVQPTHQISSSGVVAITIK